MKDKDKFIVAVKDSSSNGPIRPGKVLGRFRKREFANKARPSLSQREGLDMWRVGVFFNGTCLQ